MGQDHRVIESSFKDLEKSLHGIEEVEHDHAALDAALRQVMDILNTSMKQT